MPEIKQIRNMLAMLTNKQRSIAEYLLANPVEASAYSLRELAERTGTSEVSVLRTCTALGFEGYADLRRELTKYTQSAFSAAHPAGGAAPGLSAKIRDVCAADMGNLTNMIESLDEESLFRCARQILAAKELYLFAHDASEIIAQYMQRRLDFLCVNTTIVPVGNGDTVQSMLARLHPADCAVIFSFPPYYEPIRNIAGFCRLREVPIIAVTDSGDSPAAVEGSSVFLCGTAAKYFYNSQVATISFINILSACAAMCMGRRFDEILAREQYVNDFMRGGYSAGEDE